MARTIPKCPKLFFPRESSSSDYESSESSSIDEESLCSDWSLDCSSFTDDQDEADKLKVQIDQEDSNFRDTDRPPEQPLGGYPEQPLGADPEKSLGADPEKSLGADPEKSLGVDPEKSLGVDPEKSLGVDPEKSLGVDSEQPLGVDAEQPLGVDAEQPLGVDAEQPLGVDPEQPLGVDPEKPLGVPLKEALNELPEEEPFNVSTGVISIGEDLENADPNAHAAENEMPQKKRILSISQETCQENLSKKKIKRQCMESDKIVKPAETDIFPVHVIYMNGESYTYPSTDRTSKRKLPSSASESESAAKKQSKQLMENSGALETRVISHSNDASESDKLSTSKIKLDELSKSCDDQFANGTSANNEIDVVKKTIGIQSDQLSPEVTASTSANELSENDLKDCLSQEVVKSDEFQYKVNCEDSNFSADDEADDVQKSYFLSDSFVRKYRNSDPVSKDGSDSPISPEEGPSTSSVQLSKKKLNLFQPLKHRKKKLDREKSTEDPYYPIKIEHLRKVIIQTLPDTNAEKMPKSKKHENSASEPTENEKSPFSDIDNNRPLENEISPDNILLNLSTEDNLEEEQCVPTGSPEKNSEEKSSGPNTNRSLSMSSVSKTIPKNKNNSSKTSVIEQSSDKSLVNISNDENSEDEQCVPNSTPIKISNETLSSPSAGRSRSMNLLSKLVQTNETSVSEESSSYTSVSLSDEESSEEEQCVPENKKDNYHKDKNINENVHAHSLTNIRKTKQPSRRQAIKKVVATFGVVGHPWRKRVFAWVRTVYPDLVPEESEPDSDPVPDDRHQHTVIRHSEPNVSTKKPEQPCIDVTSMQPDDFFVDNINNTLEVAAEACVEAVEMVDKTDDQLYCLEPLRCTSPSDPSADDELSDNEAKNKKSPN